MQAGTQDYCVPDYSGGGFLNLIASLGAICGRESPYAPLSVVDTSEWSRVRNLVLLLVDGLGMTYLEKNSQEGFIRNHCVATLSSVCPSTTAAAIPTAMTGLPPAAHGLTGWHVYLSELDAVVAVLPMTGRGVELPPPPARDPERLFGYSTLYQGLQRPSRIVSPMALSETAFTQFHTRGAASHPYHLEAFPLLAKATFWRRRQDMFGILRRLCHEPGPQSFSYVYWPYFDCDAHEYGVDGVDTLKAFRRFDAEFEQFMWSIRGTDTLVVLTADHGQIDSPEAHSIHLRDHRQLAQMLSRPLCGERRFAYCYVKPETRTDFEAYVAEVFSQAMEAWPREKLLDEHWLGPGPINDRLPGRIGDYVLAMKGDWTVRDQLPREAPLELVGVHGGLSAAETRIPLCLAWSS